jgi:hypothetical protein
MGIRQSETLCLQVWPAIDRREAGGVFIAQLAEPVDEQYLLQTFGSGRYLLMVKDRRQLLRKHTVSVHSLDKPPKVNPSEVLQEPQNDRYFRIWGKPANLEKPPDQAGRSDVNEVLTTVLEKTGSFDPRLADLWEKTTKERDELARALAAKNAPPDLLEVAKHLKELFPPQPAPSEKLDVLGLVAALKGMQPPPQDPLAVLQQAKDLFAPASPPERGDDEIARLDQILGFAQKLAAIRGASGGSRSGWDIGLDFARELGPNVVQPVLQLINNMLVLRSQPKGATAAAPVPGVTPSPTGAFDPYANPARMREYAATMRTSAPPTPGAPAGDAPPAAAVPPASPTAATATDTGQQPQPPAELAQLFAEYGGLVLNALNNGTTGANFGDWVAAGFGIATYATLAGHGEDKLVQTMLGIPELALFGEARLRKFCYEFVNFEQILQDEDDEAEKETAAASNA